jgi:CBS domain-containing protein
MQPGRRQVSEIMQREVATLVADEHLDLADDVMALGRVRHMPVLDGMKLVGVVSHRDVLAASLTKLLAFRSEQRRAFLRSVLVREVMTRDPVTVGPETTLSQAARELLKHKVGCLPVTKPDGTLLGLVTETDLLRAGFLAGENDEEVEVSPVSETRDRMQKEVESLRQTRDELRVQMHLAASEAKEQWERLEKKWHQVEGRVKQVVRGAEEPIQDVGEAAQLLIDELREGYHKLRKLL